MEKLRYLIIIEGDGRTNYSAYSPDVPGCVATADSVEDCRLEMESALAFHIEGLTAGGDPVPPPSSVAAYVEVES